MKTQTLNKAISFGLSLMLTFMTVLTSPASAQSSKRWTTVASAGVVDNDDLDEVSLGTGGVAQLNTGPAPNAVATIRYNVVATDGIFDALGDPGMRVRYMDNGPQAQVVVSLYRVNLTTGAYTKLLEFDSNDPSNSNGIFFYTETTANCAGVNFDFDFTIHAYYVEAKLIRSSSLGLAKLASIQLFTHQNPACHQ